MIKAGKALWPVLLVAFVAGGWALSATPVRDRILDRVSLNIINEQVMLNVQLSFPFRYLSHFPLDEGRELRIRLQPVRVSSSDMGAVFQREGMVPADADSAAIDEVIYEGDIAGGPYLTVRFTARVRYEVIPGADYRSMNILLHGIH